jgi:hypothetical protein
MDAATGSVIGSGVTSSGNLIGTILTNRQNERLTRESWLREDNAVQRRTKDLEDAGINPLLAAGQAASSSAAIPMKAPQLSDFGGAFVAGKQADTQVKLMEHTRDMGEANLQNSTKVANAQVAHLKAQSHLTDAQSLQALHDMVIFKRRGTTSKDNGLMNQVMTGIDHLTEALAGKNAPGRILEDAGKGVLAGAKIVPKNIYFPGAKEKMIEEGKKTPRDSWQSHEAQKTIKRDAKGNPIGM